MCLLPALVVTIAAWAGGHDSAALEQEPNGADCYVAPDGNDANPGTQQQPVATLARARDVIRHLKKSAPARDWTVWIRGGNYTLAEPVVFGTQDSAPDGFSITYAAYPGERPAFSGGRRIQGWKEAAAGKWIAELPEVKDGEWSFDQLFVNGQRRPRARYPNSGFLRVASGSVDDDTRFQFQPGDLAPLAAPTDAQLVFLHDWSISRVAIDRVEEDSHTLVLRDPIGAKGARFFRITGFEPHPRYYLENAPEYLDRQGEWHLDRRAGTVAYMPLISEDMNRVQVVAPMLERLLVVRGAGSVAEVVRNVRFIGLEFSHAAAPAFPNGYAGVQAGFHEVRSDSEARPRRGRMPAAVVFENTLDCHFQDGVIRHVGGSAISLQGRCENNRVVGNEIGDVGGNGIMVGEPSTGAEHVAKLNLIANNHIHNCGAIYHGSVGVWVGITDGTMVRHNHIHHLPYTGVSVGWMWNTSATPCRGNVIELNHIHHVMQMLSDGGGIYTLGHQPETVLRANLIHDVPLNAGRAESNGMFIDEGSSEILIEQNTIYNTARSPIRFHQATGDTVRNNILVTPDNVPTFRYNATDEKSMTYEGNQAPDAAEWTGPASSGLLAGLEPEYRRREVAASADGTSDAFPYNRMLGRGVNLGNALEAPREGAWGLTLKDSYFSEIKRAGFDSVRIPIRWSAHAQAAAPYGIDEEFFERVDWVVNTALESGLVAVINMHHYDDIFEAPDEHRQRFVQLWKQIALRYRSHSDRLYFELLNEPHANLNNQRWNDYLMEVLQVVRETNPDRIVIIGPAGWNNPAQLPTLELPENDRRLIVTFHYYNPFQFTHQAASWVADSDRWRGTRWQGTEQEQQAVRDDFEKAAQWATQANLPLYLGEFGAYREAPMESRARWTRHVRDEAERQGMSWAYWEFASGFGVFDPAGNQWRPELLEALTGGQRGDLDSSHLTP